MPNDHLLTNDWSIGPVQFILFYSQCRQGLQLILHWSIMENRVILHIHTGHLTSLQVAAIFKKSLSLQEEVQEAFFSFAWSGAKPPSGAISATRRQYLTWWGNKKKWNSKNKISVSWSALYTDTHTPPHPHPQTTWWWFMGNVQWHV